MIENCVVLDPGHGGYLPCLGSTPNRTVGANGMLEKDLVLAIAREAVADLSRDMPARLTREGDENLPIAERAARARHAGALLFVSLHLNSSADPQRDGTEAFVCEAAGPAERSLGRALARRVAEVAGTRASLHHADLGILRGEHHLAGTLPCLLELAYLSNPDQARRLARPGYLRAVAGALANGIRAFVSGDPAMAQVQAAIPNVGERLVHEVEESHEDPQNVPINLPEPGSGQREIAFEIPGGLRFSRWEIHVLAESAGATYGVEDPPDQGASGRRTLVVKWSHPPYGRIRFKLRLYASPDGRPGVGRVLVDAPGWLEKAKSQVAQGVPLDVRLQGWQAQALGAVVMKKHEQARNPGYGVVGYDDAVILALIGLGIVALASAVIVVGMVTLAAVLYQAMEKGYDIRDAGYTAATGEGDTRQEHKLNFVIAPPSAGQ